MLMLHLEAAEHIRPHQTEPPSSDVLLPSGVTNPRAFRPPVQGLQFQQCRVMGLVVTSILHTAADGVLARGRAQWGLQ